MQKKQKANLALAISAAGFLGTLPAGGFWGGLLHHGFLAATVGGLADWFAVTAIFSKPLGISYRTDILRRNRPAGRRETCRRRGAFSAGRRLKC